MMLFMAAVAPAAAPASGLIGSTCAVSIAAPLASFLHNFFRSDDGRLLGFRMLFVVCLATILTIKNYWLEVKYAALVQ